MRSFHRAVATAIAGLAFAAAGIAGAAPALASPEDGEGCVGTPSVPASYVCVISVTPLNALPTVTTTNVPVTVPEICYFLDCTEETVVNVPVPGITPSSGVVAVLWYQGQYIPISVGTGTITTLINDTVDLAVEVANDAIATVNDVIAGLPTVDEVVDLVIERLQPTIDRINDIIAGLPTVDEIRDIVDRELGELVDRVRDILDTLPTVDELRDRIMDLLGPISCNIDPVC